MDDNAIKTFKTVYWGKDKSTEAQFQTASALPPNVYVSACMIVAITDEGKIALSKPERGWGLLGGHAEEGETPEQCIRREAMEEAAVELGELMYIGHWATNKVFESEHNRAYPSATHMPLYVSKIQTIHDFTPQLEISERCFIDPSEMASYHHKFEDFDDIYEYVLETIESIK